MPTKIYPIKMNDFWITGHRNKCPPWGVSGPLGVHGDVAALGYILDKYPGPLGFMDIMCPPPPPPPFYMGHVSPSGVHGDKCLHWGTHGRGPGRVLFFRNQAKADFRYLMNIHYAGSGESLDSLEYSCMIDAATLHSTSV